MSVNSVTFNRTATADEAVVVCDGRTTVLDLTKYKRKARSELVMHLTEWKLSGYKGYPNV